MEKISSIQKLKEALSIADKTLDDLKEESTKKSKKKKDRITKATEKAYELLNCNKYTEKEIEKCTNDIWASMMDDVHHTALLIFFSVFLLAGMCVFTVYQAYTFINDKRPVEDYTEFPTGDISDLLNIEFINTDVINLRGQTGVDDEKGLENTPIEFTIKNDSQKIIGENYAVNYKVNLILANINTKKTIDKKYIKYKYVYTNTWTGRTYESRIGTLEELKINEDGSLTLMTGTQLKDTQTNFKIVFWISDETKENLIDNDFMLKFRISASLTKI